MARVVSLIASSTEIVHALGQGARLVARSHECDHPPGVLDLPAITEPRFPTDGTSRDIDWGGLMAASTLTAIPVVIFFLIVQRRIAFGLTAGAVKA